MSERSPVIVMEVPANISLTEGKAFLQELRPMLEMDRPRVVLDCSQLQSVDSAGVEILLQCIEEAMKRDGDVKLAALSRAPVAMLELMRVDRLFEIYETAEEAARSFQLATAVEGPQTPPWYSAIDGVDDAKAAS